MDISSSAGNNMACILIKHQLFTLILCVMKKKRVEFTNLQSRFRDVKMVRERMDYLTGGDGGGSEGGVDDPWKPPA